MVFIINGGFEFSTFEYEYSQKIQEGIPKKIPSTDTSALEN